MKDMMHAGTKELRTERLILRRYTLADAQAVFDGWMGVQSICDVLGWQAHRDVSVTRRLIDMWIESYESPTVYHWCITFDGRAVGDIMVCKWNQDDRWCELGYCIAKDYQGRGLATEALGCVCRYLFDPVGFHRIQLRHEAGNDASGRVMRKCGFQYEGTHRHAKCGKDGVWRDVCCYSLLASDRA